MCISLEANGKEQVRVGSTCKVLMMTMMMMMMTMLMIMVMMMIDDR